MRTGEPALLLAATIFGVGTTVSVVALRAVRPVDLLAVEISGAAVLLVIAALARGRLRRRGAGRQMLVGALVPGLAFLFGDLGLARTSASSGSLLLAAEPLLSVLLAVVLLRERLSGRAVAALLLGLIGGALVALGPRGRSDTTLGNALVLLAVAASALYLIATRRFNEDDDGLNASAWQSTGGALSVAPFVVGSWSTGGTRLDTAGASAWVACLAVVVCGAIGGVLFNRGIARVPAARAGQLDNLTPLVGTLTAVVFLGDRPSVIQLAGGVAVLAGLALLLRFQEEPCSAESRSPAASSGPRDGSSPPAVPPPPAGEATLPGSSSRSPVGSPVTPSRTRR
ncbi:DMT family transporter [Cryptosporangium phraense]|uniref:DMT family transporter n=1 Tax=Cryptosporangium phraense TaxID=2593070 RepID=UPI00197B023E|nr:DMT family transporter [Cryptosporangium phraense]